MTGSVLAREIAAVHRDGWTGEAGAALFNHLRNICLKESQRWVLAAGSLDDAAASAVGVVAWQLIRAGRLDDLEKAVRLTARRAYAAEAAASQTGMGSPGTKGLVSHARSNLPARSLEQVFELPTAVAGDLPLDGIPAWMKAVGVRLAQAGWSWPVPPLWALIAVISCGMSRGGLKERSPLIEHDTGVPHATWTALRLLSLGTGPGCVTGRRWPGAWSLAEEHGLEAMRSDAEIGRLIRAAVEGRTVRTGRSADAEAAKT